MTELVLARLQRAASKEASRDTEWAYLSESLRLEGIGEAMKVIELACKDVLKK